MFWGYFIVKGKAEYSFNVTSTVPGTLNNMLKTIGDLENTLKVAEEKTKNLNSILQTLPSDEELNEKITRAKDEYTETKAKRDKLQAEITGTNTAVQNTDDDVQNQARMNFSQDEDSEYMELAKEPEKKASELSENDLRYLLENAQNGLLDGNTYIPIRAKTPQFFIDVVYEHSKHSITVMDVPMASTVEHLIQNMEAPDGADYYDEERPHELSIDDVVDVSKTMGHPQYIVLQKNGRYAMVVSFYSEKKRKKVIAAIDFADDNTKPKKNYKYAQYMNGYEEGYYNIVVTEFEPDSLKAYLANNEIVYDKQKMNGKYQVGSGRIVTFTHDMPFIEDYSTASPDKSQEKQSDRTVFEIDAEGNVLSEGQQEFFKDSKIRDENGKLLPVYHGTRNSFTVFSKDLRGSNTRTKISSEWFFAADYDTANSYYPYGVISELAKKYPGDKNYNPEKLKNKGNLYPLYLNITNPLIKDVSDYDYASHRDNADAWTEFTREAEENGNDGIILYHAQDNQLNTSARESTVYLFRDSNQAKLTSNKNPTFDDDLRYQPRTTTLSDIEILEAAQELVSDTEYTPAEKNALEIFRKRLDKLHELQERRAEAGRRYNEVL